MDEFVVDASVALKWIFEEELSGKARHLLEKIERRQIQVYAPELFHIELSNICWVRVKKKLLAPRQALQFIGLVMSLGLSPVPDQDLADVALEHALRCNITAYDALYLALAEIYAAPLITADQVLLKACKGKFDFIESLEDVRV